MHEQGIQIGSIVLSAGLMLLLTIGTIHLTWILMNAVRKWRVRQKLRRYDLNKYEIIFDNRGVPTALVDSKDKNKWVSL